MRIFKSADCKEILISSMTEAIAKANALGVDSRKSVEEAVYKVLRDVKTEDVLISSLEDIDYKLYRETGSLVGSVTPYVVNCTIDDTIYTVCGVEIPKLNEITDKYFKGKHKIQLRAWIVAHKRYWQHGVFLWVSILNPTKSAENHLFNLALSIKGGQVNEKSYICALKDIKRTTLGKRSRLKHSDYYISTDKKVAELMIRRNKPIWYKDVVLDGLKSGEDRKGEMREMVKDCQWFLDNATVRTVDN